MGFGCLLGMALSSPSATVHLTGEAFFGLKDIFLLFWPDFWNS
jgi:hypothetical protein